jgi:hypothetical protein
MYQSNYGNSMRRKGNYDTHMYRSEARRARASRLSVYTNTSAFGSSFSGILYKRLSYFIWPIIFYLYILLFVLLYLN